MKEEIAQHLHDPKALEALYQHDRTGFKQAFDALYPEIQTQEMARFWFERLHYQEERTPTTSASQKELLFVICLCFLAGFIAKIPAFTGLKEDFFYPRNIAFIVFPFLSAYFLWRQKADWRRISIPAIGILLSAVYINLLPQNEKSDTLILACIHLPLFLWALLGWSYVGGERYNTTARIRYLRYNGDLVVMSTLILIAGAILTGITLGLFALIDVKIEEFYFQYVVIWGLASAPIVGTYLVESNPGLVNKVSPVIARIFTPLVLITLVIYLIAVMVSGKDPYNDREFLLLFNLLLIGVMAIILFSIAERSGYRGQNTRTMMLFLLSVVTIVVNLIALSAIVFRISEWGITPNRLAVMGGNLLILGNLLWVSRNLLMVLTRKGEIEAVEASIARYLPVYSLWTLMVSFLFPLIFGFK